MLRSFNGIISVFPKLYYTNSIIKIMSLEISKYDLAKYPFLLETKNYLSELGYDLYEFDESMAKILDKSVRRIWISLDGNIYSDMADPDEEIISFLLALIILKIVNITSASKKFALSEARRVERFLEMDLKNANDPNLRDAILIKIFHDTLSIDVINKNNIYKIKVIDYLKRSMYFNDKYWKLINRDVYDGYVHLELDEIIRLVREEISMLIYDKVVKINIKNIPESIRNRANILREYLINDRRFKPFTYNDNLYPPCILNILKTLEDGNNPPHSARFLLATFMLSKGKNIDEVCSLFERAPDYNEKITRYQVEFLAGKKSSKSYNCPNCDKIASENLCFKDESCDNIKSPLQYRKRDGKE